MEMKKILLAEDDPNDVELTLMALNEYHIINEIEVARDGEEALDYLYRRGKFEGRPEEKPAVIFLDLKMPKIDGLEVLREIKQDPMLRSIPVVMLTSSKYEEDIVKSYRYGVNAYVVKPVIYEKFVEVIKQLGQFWAIVNEVPGS